MNEWKLTPEEIDKLPYIHLLMKREKKCATDFIGDIRSKEEVRDSSEILATAIHAIKEAEPHIAKRLVEWLDEPCVEHCERLGIKRRDCDECWQALKEEK